MAQIAYGDTGDEIRVAAPLGIPQVDPLAPLQDDGKSFVGGCHDPVGRLHDRVCHRFAPKGPILSAKF